MDNDLGHGTRKSSITCHGGIEGTQVLLFVFLTLALEKKGLMVSAKSKPLYLQEGDPVLILLGAGWAS